MHTDGNGNAVTAWRIAVVALAVLNIVIGAVFSHMLARQNEVEQILHGLSERDAQSTARQADRIETLTERINRLQVQQDRLAEDLVELKVYVYPQGSRPRIRPGGLLMIGPAGPEPGTDAR